MQMQKHKQRHLQGAAGEQGEQGRKALLIVWGDGEWEDAPRSGGALAPFDNLCSEDNVRLLPSEKAEATVSTN